MRCGPEELSHRPSADFCKAAGHTCGCQPQECPRATGTCGHGVEPAKRPRHRRLAPWALVSRAFFSGTHGPGRACRRACNEPARRHAPLPDFCAVQLRPKRGTLTALRVRRVAGSRRAGPQEHGRAALRPGPRGVRLGNGGWPFVPQKVGSLMQPGAHGHLSA